MNITKIALIAGSFYGTTAVVLGAMGAHALKKVLVPEKLDAFITGTKYQIYHALFLLILGLLPSAHQLKFYNITVWTAIVGTLFFSGSIYLLTFYKIKSIVLITPLGGIMLIISWFFVFLSAIYVKTS